MPVSLEALGDFLAAFAAPVTVGMEATLYWQWLHDQLSAGYGVRVADARKVKLIWQARSKTDPIDARKLAELLLHGRAFLVRQRTQIRNRIHGRLTSENLLFPRSCPPMPSFCFEVPAWKRDSSDYQVAPKSKYRILQPH